jgi:glutamate-1-semialdehyde 2,1-aminomutase
MVNSKSARAYADACHYLPGGVNSPVRAFGGVGMQPIFIASAKGSRIYDVDGNEYIDYVGSWGPMILGHAHPAVVEAVERAARNGTSFGAPTLAETELASKIVAAFPSIEKLRMVSSGTEAVMTAIRLARAHTGRDMIVKMAGCYHGHSDSLLVAAGSGVAEFARIGPSAPRPGVPQALAALTAVVPYNDVEAVKGVFQQYPGRVAAVLVEPVAANMGVVPPIEGYLQELRKLCRDSGALLIFDEVITGFRVALGGAQERYGVAADLTCLGKIIGGGLPLAAFGGRAEIMDLLAPAGAVYQAGTLSGNPIATAAANATLEALSTGANPQSAYAALEETSARLEEGLVQAAADARVPVTINRVGSLLSCFFTDKPVRNFADVQATNVPRFKKFFAEMIQRGIYLAPSAYEAMFVSLAHTEADIDATIQAARESFARL